MPSIGSLIVDMQLQIAKFVSNSAEVHKTIKGMEAGFRNFKSRAATALAGVGSALAAGFTIKAGVNFIREQLDFADQINKLSQSLGVSTDQLSGFVNIAQLADVSVEELVKSTKTFSNLLAKAAAGEPEARKLFDALQIDPGTIQNTKDVGSAILELSDRFASLEDGALKGALAQETLSKAGLKMIPFLNQGSESIREMQETLKAFGLDISSTFADQSERFNDSMRLLSLASEGFKRKFVIAIAGVLTAAAETFVKIRKESAETQSGLNSLDADPVTQFALTVVRAIFSVLEAFAEFKQKLGNFQDFSLKGTVVGNIKGIGTSIFNTLTGRPGKEPALGARDIEGNLLPTTEDARNEIKRWRDEFEKNFADILAGKGKPPRKKDTALAGRLGAVLGGDKDKQDALRQFEKLLDGVLQGIDRSISNIQDEIQSKLAKLQLEFQDAAIGINDFYNTQRSLQDTATAATVAAYDKQIAAIKAFVSANRGALKPEQLEEFNNKVAAIQDKQSDANKKLADESSKLWYAQKGAAEAYQKQIEDVTTQILELEGKTAEAARRRFNAQNEDFRKRLQVEATSTGNTPEQRAEAEQALKRVKVLEDAAVARQQINDISDEAGIIQDQLRNKEELLEVARKRGTIGELALLRESDDARKATVASLRALAAERENVANALPEGVIRDRELQNVRNFKVEIEKLAAASDQLRDKFDQIAESAFSDFISDAVTGTKTLKDAFKDMVNSIVSQISKLAAQDIASSLFGKGRESGNSFGGIFTNLLGFGGSKTPQPGSANFVGPVQPSASGGLAAIGSTISGTFDKLGGFFSDLFRAEGGPITAGQPYIVGERGPEMIIPRASGRVLPAGSFGGGGGMGPITMNFAITGPVTRDTQQQIARTAYEGIMRGQRRNG